MRGSRPQNTIRKPPIRQAAELTMNGLSGPVSKTKEALDEFGITYIEIERESLWSKIKKRVKSWFEK